LVVICDTTREPSFQARGAAPPVDHAHFERFLGAIGVAQKEDLARTLLTNLRANKADPYPLSKLATSASVC
jgi:hypothetical protein